MIVTWLLWMASCSVLLCVYRSRRWSSRVHALSNSLMFCRVRWYFACVANLRDCSTGSI